MSLFVLGRFHDPYSRLARILFFEGLEAAARHLRDCADWLLQAEDEFL